MVKISNFTRDPQKKGIDLLLKNRIRKGDYEYICPDKITYPWQWLWDSCFHAYVLRNYYPNLAYSELLSLTRFQTADGFLPHMSYHGKPSASLPLWGIENRSGLTQPPIIGWALHQVYKASPNVELLELLYPKIRNYYLFLESVRDPDNDGLISIIHPWESGWDDSPRWDEPARIKNYTRKSFKKFKLKLVLSYRANEWDQQKIIKQTQFNIESVSFNCLYALSIKKMKNLAEILQIEPDIRHWKNTYNKCVTSIQEKMWNEKLGIYQDLYHYKDQEHAITIFTPAIFFPMILRISSQSQAERLVSHLTNPKKFKLRWLIPTVAADEPSFDPSAYWRGTVWINVNFLVSMGLLKYGYRQIVSDISKSSINLIKREGFREYFNPISGEGLGAKEFGWSVLAFEISKLLDHTPKI